ncbi:glycosyltransferase family 2 protein [Clostridium tarantellae]|uniref:Glycosyltransferase n=1 Tax=Clostridium tarantellae TaxID=39493 RepID=A0A6I1MN68_9CLOT|nr:glycosyltransferase [Clostridium tarantellae]MPQ44410.1 glycosyltransferase [Clostridium tarantellae]
MTKIKISVIVPVYNVEMYLEQCIESIVNQTIKEIQIILIDDGSKDKSSEICDKYKNKDNRIEVIHQENKGVSKSRNIGINKAKGKYIAFIDSDDYISNNMLETLFNNAENNYSDLVSCNHFNIYENGKLKSILNYKEEICNKEEFINNFVKNNIVNGKIGMVLWDKLFRLDIINNNNIRFKSIVLEDYLFIMQYCVYVNIYSSINKCLYYYRVINNSLTKRFNFNIFENLLYVQKEKEIIMENIKFYDNNKELLHEWFLNYCKNIMFLLYYLNVDISYEKKKNYIQNIISNEKVIYYINYRGYNLYNKDNLVKLIAEKNINRLCFHLYVKAKLYRVAKRILK